MFGIEDNLVFAAFGEQELLEPSARKSVDGDRAIYVSRELQMPKKWGAPVLCDFGSAVPGDMEHSEDVQPDEYRAPEVILETPWSYQTDIWNAGCMIWDLFEYGHLFTGYDQEHQTYRSRAHLAEITALLGHPPRALLQLEKSSHKFFTDTGKSMLIDYKFFVVLAAKHTVSAGEFRPDIPLPDTVSLEERESSLEGERKEIFLVMMRKMLQWELSRRSLAKELADDEWVMAYM